MLLGREIHVGRCCQERSEVITVLQKRNIITRRNMWIGVAKRRTKS